MGTSTISVSKEIVNRFNILSLSQTKFLKILSGFFILILVFCPNDSFAQYYPEPSVETDKLDYAPGETVNITASGFIPNSIIEFQISDDPNDPGDDGEADVYTPFSIQDGGSGDLDGVVNGGIKTTWIIPTDNNNSGDGIPDAFNATLNLVALGYGEDEILYTEDDQTASTTFTDGAQALWAWRTRGPTANSWNAGTTIQQANSIYAEDDAIPFRWTIRTGNPAPQLQEGVTYIVRIEWDFAGGTASPNTYMIDYLTTWNDTQTSATGPFSTFFTGGNISTVPIPTDPELLPNVQAQAAGGVFTLYNIGSVSFVSGNPGDRYIETVFNASQTRKYIELSIIPSDGDGTLGEFVEVAIAWGGHLGAESDYGLNKGANNFPGSSPQMLVDLSPTVSGDVSNLNLSPTAIVQQGKITIVKNAVPNSLQDFSFSTSSNATTIASSFIIDDDDGVTGADETYSEQKIFFGLSPGTYTFTEDAYSSWDLTGLNASESGPEDTTPGDISSTNLGTRTLSITVANGEAWTGTFVNEASTNQPPVANDDSSTGNVPGDAVTISVTDNDSDSDGTIDPATVSLVGTCDGGSIDTNGDCLQITVTGEGTWTVNAVNGSITFTPESGFTGDPTPIDYNVEDDDGAVSNDATVTIDYDQQPSLTIAKTQSSGENPVTQPGVLGYQIVVTNDGNTSLTNVSVSDVLPDGSAGTLSAVVESGTEDGILSVDETFTYTVSYTVTQDDIDAGTTLVNTASVVTDELPTPEEDTAETPITQTPSLTIAKTQSSGENPVTQPGVLGYQIVVTNDGNTSLTNVSVSDVLPDGSAGTLSAVVESGTEDGILSVDETFTYTVSYTVTQDDIDAGTTLVNTASVVTDELPTPEEDTAETPITQTPSLTIAKTQSSGENPVTQPGVLGYQIVVTNDGNTSLTNVSVSDVLPDGSAGTLSAVVESGTEDGILSVDETFTYTVSYTVTQDDIDAGTTLVNTASVVTDELPTPEEDTAETPITQTPSLTIAKTQSSGENPVTQPGVLGYQIVVTNDGNTSLTNVSVSDVLPDGSAGTLSAVVESGTEDGILSVDETFTYTVSYTVTQDDIDAGTTLVNTASVVTDELPTPEEDTAETPITQTPSLTIAKTQSSGENPVTQPGVLGYQIVVTNDGNTSLTNVSVSDVLPDGSAGTLSAVVESGTEDGILSVDETFTYTVSYTVTQDDIDAGTTLVNTASVVTDELPTPEEDTAETPITQTPSLTIAKTQSSGENPVTQPGVLGYQIVVTNDGNTSLTNVSVSDVLPDGSAGTLSAVVESGTEDGILSVDETFTYTVSYTVTQDDIDAGTTLVNTASVVTDELPTPEEDTAETPITQTPSLTIAKTQSSGENPVTQPGVLGYQIVVTNDGNTSLTNVSVSDVLPDGSAGTLSAVVESGTEDGILSVDETFTYTVSYTVTQDDIDAGTTLVNTASVVTDELPTPEEDTAETPITQTPSLTIAKTQSSGENPVTQPGVLGYQIVVTNDGNTSLTNVSVSDVLPDGSAGTLSAVVESGTEDGILSVDETFTYTVSYTVTQDDIDAGTTLVNTASVVTDELPTPEEDTAETPITQTPSLTIAKTQSSGENPVTQPGVLGYQIVVTNDGNTSLTNVSVSDVLPDGSAGTLSAVVESGTEDGILSVDETFTYTVSYTVTQDDIDAGTTLVNTASVVTDELPTPEEDTAETPITQTPSLTIAKTQSSGENPVTQPGVLGYQIVVTNDGNTSLTNVSVSDVLPDGSAGTLSAVVESGTEDGILSVDETFTYTVSYTVTQDDIDAGTTLVNTASVVTDELPTPEEDTAETPITQTPSLTIAKTQSSGENPVTQPGVLGYQIVVTNDGNTSLTNVSVSDVLPDGSAGTLSAVVESGTEDGILSVDETFTYTVSYTVTQDDIDAGTTLVNTASVVTDELPTPEEDTAETPITQTPSLTIAKTQSSGENPVTQPGVLGYQIVVTNDGNTSLTNVSVSDVLPDGSAGTLSAVVESGTEDGILSVDETFTYTVSYTVTQDDIDAGTTLVNTASVVTDELPTPEEDTAETPITQTPSLTIAKTQSSGENPVTQPGVLGYQIVVTNDGNTSLTNVSVSDVLPDGSAGTLSAVVESGTEDGILSVDETFTYTVSYTVTQDDIDAGTTLVNTASVVTDELPTPEEDTAETPITQTPSLTIAKTQSSGENPVTQPGVLGYQIVVTNDGNTSLTNVSVSDVLPDGSAGTLSAVVESGTEDGILSVDETFTYTVSYTVTQDDIDAGTTLVNTASVVTDELPTPEEDTAETPITQTPSLTIAKTQSSGENPVTQPGVLGYQIVVTNDGNTSLTNVSVSDVLPDGSAGTLSAVVESGTEDGILSVDETFTYTVSYTVTQDDIDAGTTLVNTASVVTDELPTPEEDTAETPITQTPSLTIAKTQSSGENPVTQPGVLGYQIVVTNDGNTSLTNVSVSDVLPDGSAGTLSAVVESGTEDGILSVDETFTYTVSYTVTQDDIDAGTTLVNTASVVTDELPTPEEDTAETPITQTPSLTIAKTQSSGENPVTQPGVLGYQIVVTNDGNTSLTNVSVSDVLPDGSAGTLSAVVESGTEDGILSVDETFTYTVSYTVTQDDIDAGTTLVNTASVVTDELPTPEEDTAETPITQTPSLTIAKTQSSGENPVTQPGVLGYQIVVTNDGNTSLTNVSVSDVLPDGSAGTLSAVVESGTEDGILSVDETFTYTVSYTVTQDDIDAGTTLVNTASVVTDELPTPEEDTAETPITQTPSLTIAKTQSSGENPVTQPGVLGYQIVVTNDGNTSLTNVSVSDVLPDGSAGTLSAVVESGTEDGILSVDETFTYTVSYTVTQDDIDAGTTLVNTASVVTDELPTPEEDTAETPITQTPSLTIAKTQSSGENPVTQPGVLGYQIVVTNDGNTSLTNVSVSDVLPDGSAGTLSAVVESGTEDGILSVDETFTYTVSYTVTQDDIDAGTTLVNTASVVTDELPTPEEDTAETPITQTPSLTIAKTQSSGENPVTQPGVLGYQIVVTNDGNTSLTNVSVSDVLPDGSAGTLSAVVESGTEDGILSVDETFTYTVSYTVTQDDIDAGTTLVNTASVVTDELPTPEEDTAETPITQTPSLTIAKTQSSGENPVTQPGVLGYQIVVTNDGNTSLTNVSVSDVLPDGSAGTLSAVVESGTEDGILSVDETFTYTVSYTVTQDDIDAGTTLVNTASVVTDELPTPEEDTAETPITQTPSLTIAKTQSSGENPVTQPGVLGYQIVVTNDGNTSLTNVSVSDVLPDGSAGTLSAVVESGTEDGILSVDETFTYTVSYTVTQDDIDAGTTLVNTASVVTDELPTPEEDTAETPITQTPSLTIAKTQSSGENPVTQPGVLGYQIVVTNDGNTSLTNVSVSDVLPDGSAGTLSAVVESGTEDGILSVDETFTYTVSYTVTQDDIDAGTTLVNTASVVTDELPTPEEDTAETPITQTPSLTIAKTQSSGENPVTQPGVLGYQIVVTNDGNTSLTNVSVSDVLPDGSAGTLSAVVESGTEDGILSVDETFTYTVSYTVTQDDIDAGTTLVNTASVVTDELPTPEEDTAETPITQTPSLTIAKTQSSGENPVTQPGVLGYQIVVTNDGNTSLTNVSVSDVLPDGSAGTLSAVVESGTEDGILSVDETFTYTVSYTVTQDDIDAGTTLVNTASVVTDELPTPEEDTAETPITQTPSLTIAKTQSSGENPVTQPGVLGYQIVVTNDGNTSLTNVSVSDVLPDGSAGTLSAVVESGTEDGILSVDETFTYTVSYTVTQDDIDAGTTLVNTASVVTDELPTPEEDTAETPITQTPSLTIAKTQSSGENPVTQPGVLGYQIVVTNDGNTSLTNVSVSDVLPDGSAGTLSAVVESGTEDGILSVDETFTYTVSYTVTQDDIDAGTTLVNTASVVTDELPTPEEDTAETPITQTPSLTIAKTQSSGENPVTQPGVLGYQIVVTNDGNTSLTNVSVSDVLPDGSAGTLSAVVESGTEDGILSVDETFTYTVSYTVTQDDIDAGTTLVNTASVVTDELPTPEEDTAETPITQTPSLTIAKTQSSGENPVTQPGVLGYQIVVTNDGNTSLTNVSVSDVLPDGSAGTLSAVVESGTEDGILSVDETFTYTVSYTVTQDDIDAGTTLVNTASVVTDELPTPEEDTAETPITQTPSLTIAKTQSSGENPVTQPGVLGYQIVVTNDGNTSLTNVSVSDVLPDGSAGTLSAVVESGTEDGILSVDETFTYTVSYTVTQDDIDAGTTLVNTASVVTDELPTPEEDTAETPITQTPSLTIAKTQSSGENPVTQPGVLGYQIVVTNDGNTSLTNVSVSDVLPDGSAGTLSAVVESGTEDGILSVDETFTYTVSYTVTQDDIDAGTTLVNTASVVTDELPTPEEDTAETPITQTPLISIVKTGTFNDENGDGFADVGETISYVFAVSNDGNVTLTNVTVSDANPLVTVTGGPTTLDVGETDDTTFSGSYTITQADIDAGKIDNTATVDSNESAPATDDETTSLPQNPLISIVKTFTDDSVIAGGDGSSFTLVVKNEGNVTLSDVLIEDMVDSRLSVTSVYSIVGSDADSDSDVQTVEWLISSLAPNASATISIEFDVNASVDEANGVGGINDDDNVPNNAIVGAEAPQGDPDDLNDDITDNGEDTIDIHVDINLSIVKTFVPEAIEVPQGTFQKFTIVVSNSGPSDAVGVSVTDTVDDILEVTDVNVTSGSGVCIDDNGQEIDCTIDVPAGESVEVTVDYITASFLDAESPYSTTAGGDDFYFVFVNGSILEGTTRGDGEVYLNGVDITSDVTIVRSLTRNDIIFDPDGHGGDPAFELHLSCSDPFTGGWGQSAGPVEGVDVNWQIAYFTIARFNNNGFMKSCGNVVNEFEVDNTAYASGEDSSGTQNVSDDDFVTVGPGITLDRLQTKGKRLTARLNNLTGDPKTIADIEVKWPDSNGNLSKVWLTDGNTSVIIWQGMASAPSAHLFDEEDSSFEASYIPKWTGGTLEEGEAILRFDFQNKVANTGYTIRVYFDDATWLDINVDGDSTGARTSKTVEDSKVVEESKVMEPSVAEEETTMVIYPNPATTTFSINLEGYTGEFAEILLFDLNGRQLLRVKEKYTPGSPLQINLPYGLNEGLYYVKLNDGSSMLSQPIIIKKE